MEQLKLDNQLCFPFYSVSRLITKRYQPLLNNLGITYPQYLVLLVLWENDNQTVNKIAKKLYLQTNTITPLLQRLEVRQIVMRTKSENDERKVFVSLTNKGKQMKEQAAAIPFKLMQDIEMPIEELIRLRDQLQHMIHQLSQ